jgi:hypothetical protein
MQTRKLGSSNPHPKYAELLARKKLRPAQRLMREIALDKVNDTLERMTRFDTVGFEVITRFTEVCMQRRFAPPLPA